MALFAIALGGLVTAAALVAVTSLWPARSRFMRPNFRGAPVIVPAGQVLLAPLAMGYVFSRYARGPSRAAPVVILSAFAVAALGYVDDVYGSRHAGGLAGHARALLRGTATTGTLKAAGGAIVGLASASAVGRHGLWIVVAGAVVALSSNLANLLDLRPGRLIKAWIPLALALSFAGRLGSARLVLAALAGGVLSFLVWELRETVMLGDTGAGLLGAVLGVGAVAVLGRTSLVLVLVLLLGLTLASEFVSFTRVIERVRPLRWLDALGRIAQ